MRTTTGPDVKTIFDSCMAGNRRISATDAATARRSPFSLYCRYHADPANMDPPDPFLEALRSRGIKHESDVLESDHPDMKSVPYDTPEEGFMAALKSMAGGSMAVSNPPLFWLPEGMHGYPDLLERRDGRSAFGNHHYVVREIKAAKHVRAHHTVQAAFYALMLANIQRRPPETFLITNGGGTIEYSYREHENHLSEAIRKARRIRDGWVPPAVYGTGIPPWSNHNNETAIKNNDVSLIPGIGQNVRAGLVAAGLRTVRDVVSATAGSLMRVNGIGGLTSVRYHSSARAISSGECVRRGRMDLPKRPTEIFLDLEGVGGVFEEEPGDYLIGALVRVGGVERYHPFVAEEKREDKMLESFLKFMDGMDDYTIYHWGLYERAHLKSMMERHRMYGSYLLLDRKVMIDLSKVATDAFAFPTYKNTLKDIAGWMGFRWRHADVSATSAIELYLRYVDDPEAGREGMRKVIDYNEDDCVATRTVKDWLAGQAGRWP